MKNIGLSDKIRQRAVEKYLLPALESGQERFSIRIKELMRELETEGFPPNHPAQFCTALKKQAFLQEYGVALEGIEGPRSGMSTTVVLHFRIAKRDNGVGKTSREIAPDTVPKAEDPTARAKRVTAGLRGLLKNEIAAYGGTEAFIRWVRSDEDEAA